MPEPKHATIEPAELEALVRVLRERGYLVVGPTMRDGAIVYEELESADELPVGWTDHQDGGTYRLEPREDEARFGYAVGPHSWKQFLFPPRVRLWRARGSESGVLEVEEEPRTRGRSHSSACARAICTRSRSRTASSSAAGSSSATMRRAARARSSSRSNCFEPGGTCFCVSMGTGPRAESGYDLALTEILEGEHRLLVEVGLDARRGGARASSDARPATDEDVRAAGGAVDGAAERMGRHMDAHDLRDLLAANLEHPRWDDVADRCLTCGNCTLVCPTCFCSTVEDHTDLTGENAERWRTWDSCFSVDHSYIHGGSVRPSNRSRYRQWMTHKLGTWHDQFGTSGCVGCGRCITWCPVGIDITEEVAAIRATGGDDGATA